MAASGTRTPLKVTELSGQCAAPARDNEDFRTPQVRADSSG